MVQWDTEKRVNRLVFELSEVEISRHPFRKDATLILNKKTEDIYSDNFIKTECFLHKFIILSENITSFVQNEGIFLLESETAHVVTMTTSGLPRLPIEGDMLYSDNQFFKVSYVKPLHKGVQSVIKLLVYNAHEQYASKIIEVKRLDKSVIEVLHIGSILRYSFDKQSWYKFDSDYIRLEDPSVELIYFDLGNLITEGYAV